MQSNEATAERHRRRSSKSKLTASPNGKQPSNGKAESQLRALRAALKAAVDGDFSVRLPSNGNSGAMREIVRNFNRLLELNGAMTTEITRVEQAVRREGSMTEVVSL